MNKKNTKKQPAQKKNSRIQNKIPSSPLHSAPQSTDTHTRQKRRRGKKQRRQQLLARCMLFLLILVFALLSVSILQRIIQNRKSPGLSQKQETEGKIPRPQLDVDLLTPNEYSRPGTALKKVKGIVIHYTANPGTSAAANRNYFEGLKDSHITKASSHFVIGLKGEIIQCIPSSEISYASNSRNKDTVSIECCIRDKSGKFEKATYDSAVHLTAWLVEHFGLKTEDVIRHYDITGKACPKYFVDYPSAWEQFLADVQAYLVSYGVTIKE